MRMPILETERLILRPFIIEDAQAAYEMNLDPEVSRYTHDGGVKTLEQIEEIVRTTTLADYEKYGFGRHAVIHKEDDRFIGFAGLKHLEDLNEVDLGYRFERKYWGQGIATEAGIVALQFGFQQLRLERVVGLVLPDNIGSVRVLEKLGFAYECDIQEEDVVASQYAVSRDQFGVLQA